MFVNNVCSFPPTLVPSPNYHDLHKLKLNGIKTNSLNSCVILVSPIPKQKLFVNFCWKVLYLFDKKSWRLYILNLEIALRIGKNQWQHFTVNLSISDSRFKALILPHLPSSYLYEGWQMLTPPFLLLLSFPILWSILSRIRSSFLNLGKSDYSYYTYTTSQ